MKNLSASSKLDYIDQVAAKSADWIGVQQDIQGAQTRGVFFCAFFLCASALWQNVWAYLRVHRWPCMPVRQACTFCHHNDWRQLVAGFFNTRSLRNA